ncbi:MAG: YegS/Rv2252/BmrU family lipid kinase [Pedobacter sp.]|nr:MAG: YegS/Rv2252/BmrU family lipid kinase [Pedobacter sp.]
MDTSGFAQKLLFIINQGSGNNELNIKDVIDQYFSNSQHNVETYLLPKTCKLDKLKSIINNAKADKVIAVGGDGTLKLVAECLLETDTPIGIIPTGSANGMAKELGISLDYNEALDTCVNGTLKKIHAVKVNGELCIHLADIGFNAYLVKKFDQLPKRGMWSYAKAAWQALWSHHKMQVEFNIGERTIKSEAAMVVIANATMYGTGVKINPEGKLDDGFFEVVLVKKYAVMEILKLKFTDLKTNPENIELFQATSLKIKTKHKVHFQVDGEYMSKVNKVEATIIPQAINVIV